MDLRTIVQPKKNPKIPDFRPGDSVRVLARIVEGDRERVQAFEGVVIRKRRGGINSSFTVRRVTHGVGVERTFLLYSPRLESVQIVRVGRVRRARLYYLRRRVGKRARVRAGSRERFEELTRQVVGEELTEEEATTEEAEAEEVDAEVETEETAEAEEEEPPEREAEDVAEEGAEAETEEAAAETEEEKAPEE